MRGVILLSLFILTSCISENPTLKRVSVRSPFLYQFGSITKPRGIDTSSNDFCNSMAIDRYENVYCAGSTNGNFADTNPDPTKNDVLVMKFDRYGTLLWARQLGISNPFGNSSGFESCVTFEVDRDGNGYCGGQTTGNFAGTFGGGTYDGIVIKFSPDGEVLWAHQFDFGFDENCNNLEITSSNRIYCGSTLDGQAVVYEFDRQTGTMGLFNFLVDPNTSCSGLTSDQDGNLYCAGSYTSPTLGTEILVGPSDALIWKLSPSLNTISKKAFGHNFSWTTNSQSFRDIEIDNLGYLYLGGISNNNFGPDVNIGPYDQLFAKVNSRTLSLEWYQQITTADLNSAGHDTDGNEFCLNIEVDASSNAYCTYSTTSNLSDTFAGIGSDIFLTKVSPSGVHLATIQFGQSAGTLTGGTYDNDDLAFDLRIDSSGNIYIGGYTLSDFREPKAGFDVLMMRLPPSLSLGALVQN